LAVSCSLIIEHLNLTVRAFGQIRKWRSVFCLVQIYTHSCGNSFGILLMGKAYGMAGSCHRSYLNGDCWLLSDEPREQAGQRVGGPGAWLKCKRQPGFSAPCLYPGFSVYAKEVICGLHHPRGREVMCHILVSSGK